MTPRTLYALSLCIALKILKTYRVSSRVSPLQTKQLRFSRSFLHSYLLEISDPPYLDALQLCTLLLESDAHVWAQVLHSGAEGLLHRSTRLPCLYKLVWCLPVWKQRDFIVGAWFTTIPDPLLKKCCLSSCSTSPACKVIPALTQCLLFSTADFNSALVSDYFSLLSRWFSVSLQSLNAGSPSCLSSIFNQNILLHHAGS